jgi:hypothetical protein
MGHNVLSNPPVTLGKAFAALIQSTNDVLHILHGDIPPHLILIA